MYRTIEDFTKDWAYESASTQKLFQNITDASLKQRINDQGRELGRLATHITESVGEMLHTAGLPIEGPNGQPMETPSSASEIQRLYREIAEKAPDVVRSNWTDAGLTEEVEMYGQKWNKGTVLSALVMHQVHHRGQLTVLMRQAGLVVPGMYGPAREEWAAMGMPAMA